MWEKVKVIWKIPELRSKIGLTLLMLAIYRVGFQIQVPILDQAKVNSLSQQKGGVGDMLRPAPRSVPRRQAGTVVVGAVEQ